MTLNKTLVCTLALHSFALTSMAHSVAFEENFDNDYTANFPVLLDLDH